ncbi:TetR/AcrR family transcriptional regulator [Nitriliruptoraceae bacterium ZYF776]|nr:TetR/AcrR family transcriptional regulator [Profundirhabdus halotolerans]
MTVGRIVDAAVELLVESGLAALSMRKVADRLGVGAMSLYTYVPGKDELVMLAVERAFGQLPRALPAGVGWRGQLETLAAAYWDLYRDQPWLLDVPVTRPVLGPNAFDRYELELRAVDGIGLSELEMTGVIELIQGHVESVARRATGATVDARRSGVSDDEWWEQVSPVLEEVLADRDYPVSSRVGEAIGAPHTDPVFLLRFGLDRILDGVEHLLASRPGPAGPEADAGEA